MCVLSNQRALLVLCFMWHNINVSCKSAENGFVHVCCVNYPWNECHWLTHFYLIHDFIIVNFNILRLLSFYLQARSIIGFFFCCFKLCWPSQSLLLSNRRRGEPMANNEERSSFDVISLCLKMLCWLCTKLRKQVSWVTEGSHVQNIVTYHTLVLKWAWTMCVIFWGALKKELIFSIQYTDQGSI